MQNHLNKSQTINLGSFYTPDYIVEIVYKMLLNYLVKKNKLNLNDFVLLDSSCGYGNFGPFSPLRAERADLSGTVPHPHYGLQPPAGLHRAAGSESQLYLR